MTSIYTGQLILGTDKRNPLFTVYYQEEEDQEQLHVYYGLELLDFRQRSVREGAGRSGSASDHLGEGLGAAELAASWRDQWCDRDRATAQPSRGHPFLSLGILGPNLAPGPTATADRGAGDQSAGPRHPSFHFDR